jgi:hypothetical protein
MIGYELHPSQQGHGYTIEAATCCFAWGFQSMDLNRIEAQIHPPHVLNLTLPLRAEHTHNERPTRPLLGVCLRVTRADTAEQRTYVSNSKSDKVTEYMDRLVHARKPEVEQLRDAILSAGVALTEQISGTPPASASMAKIGSRCGFNLVTESNSSSIAVPRSESTRLSSPTPQH